jgi:hypothetical protein
MFLGVCFVIAMRQGRVALTWLAVPLVAALTWFVMFDLPVLAGRGGTLTAGLSSIPLFVAGGVVSAAGALFGLTPPVGVVVLSAVLLVALRLHRGPRHGLLAAAALAGLILEYGLVAVSRADFGLIAVTWSRYLYVAVPLLLLAIAAWFGEVPFLREPRRLTLAVALAGLTAVAVVGNIRYYLLGRDLTMQTVHETRAAVAIAEGAPDLIQWTQELHLPGPGEVRDLIAAYGTPARDDLLPGIVPPVPDAIADAACRQLLPGSERLAGCLRAVGTLVGAE